MEFRSRNSKVEEISLILSKPTVIKPPPNPSAGSPVQIFGAEVVEKPFDSAVPLKNIHVQTETPTCYLKSAFCSFCTTKIAQNKFTPSLCPKNSYLR